MTIFTDNANINDALIRAMRLVPYFRGRQRILNTLIPKCGSRNALIHGFSFQLSLGEVVQRNMYMGTYDPAETKLVTSLLRPGSTFVDAGANIGYYTALAAKLVGMSGRVLAIEPFAPLYRRLVNTFRGTTQVRCLQIALGEKSGRLSLYVPPVSYGNIDPSVVEYTDGMQRVEVPVRRLDDVLCDYRVPGVDILKIDVEGCEPQLIRGCVRSFRAGMIRALLCEINPRLLKLAGSSSDELISQLQSVGFRAARPVGDKDIENVLFLRTI